MRIEICTRTNTVRIFNKKPFNESDVCRNPKGEFAPKGTGKKQQRTKEEILGPCYSGYKGMQAILKLYKHKQGHVPNAFERADIGKIDIFWGDEDFGLRHIIKRRWEEKQNITKVLWCLTQTIEHGFLTISRGKFAIRNGDYEAIIKPKLNGEELKFVLTAFEIRKIE